MNEKDKTGRLSATVRPERYQINLKVIPSEKRFSGDQQIDLQIAVPTGAITLHVLDLDIAQAGETTQGPAAISFDSVEETVTLTFPSPLPVGRAHLLLQFSGRLNQQLRGLYEATALGETYAFTQFEPTDARRMFPCFDEPAMKATFSLTVTVPSDLTAISNMPILAEKQMGELKTVVFSETPVMSTYLLALGVCRLESKTLRVANTALSVWTLPGQIALGEFALKVASAVLPLLNNYFDLPYPCPKLDLISVPDFAMGAMENWGAIFFRDSRLLIDEAASSTTTQRDVANVITHEIVHQWFGNLVTMVWWDDLWLNEAFATWLACKIVDQWRPEWNSWVTFQQEKQVPLQIDALQNSRPIRADVHHAAEIEEMFDALTYEKGAACLRMIEQFLGEDIFRQGIRHYMKEHQLRNARAADLWQALERVSGQTISAMAQDWFSQPGFPLVTIQVTEPSEDRVEDVRPLREVQPLRVVMAQHRFCADGTCPEVPRWSVPFRLKYKDDTGVHSQPILFDQQITDLPLPVVGNLKWIYGNEGEIGFLRVGYDSSLMNRLLSDGISDLAPEEKIGLLNHLFAQCQRGEVSMADFMNAIGQFKGDPTRVVVEAVVSYLEIISNQIVTPSHRPSFTKSVQELLHPIWETVGFGPTSHEGDETRLTRAAAFWGLGALAKDERILSELPRLQTRYWAKPASLDSTLATPLIRLCARVGGEAEWNRYIKKFESAPTPEERDRYLTALTDFNKLTTRVLEYSLSEKVRSQDVWRPIRLLLAQPDGQEEAWRFMQKHWQALMKKGGSVGAQRMISGTRWLWRPEWHREVTAFFARPENQVAAARRTLLQTLEMIQNGIRFKEQQPKEEP